MSVALLILSLLILLFYIVTMTWYAVSFQRETEISPGKEFLSPESEALSTEKEVQEPGKEAKETVGVSLVVPVRNEADRLSSLFDDLLAQDHGLPGYEVIFVDDHSTDRSASLLEIFCHDHQHCRLIRLGEGANGKKAALAAGIEAAIGNRIIQSDADCRLPEGFISGHAGLAAGGADLVAGPVVLRPGRQWWERFEALEQFSLVATGIAAAASGRPVMCSGANLSYGKHIYLVAKKKLHAVPHASGDDIFLLAEAKKQGSRIVFPTAPGMVVTTTPSPGALAFLQQRIRWGSKARYYRDRDMVLLSVLVWLANTVLAGLLIAALFIKGVIWVFLLALALKSLSEYLLLHKVAARLRQKPLLRIFPAAALFYYFYIAVTGVIAMTGTFTWKGRRKGGSWKA